eukprot:TRINITY_DN2892_c0_g1_i2.p1 TRINITY_DN2892_c0_g1~~TRINITY_DN2892_c0_g1_i2.p1  ORF type:complete len:953 (-),score=179.32 TRINITY_DN2892_c0_g1_i2:63-2921(-)
MYPGSVPRPPGGARNVPLQQPTQPTFLMTNTGQLIPLSQQGGMHVPNPGSAIHAPYLQTIQGPPRGAPGYVSGNSGLLQTSAGGQTPVFLQTLQGPPPGTPGYNPSNSAQRGAALGPGYIMTNNGIQGMNPMATNVLQTNVLQTNFLQTNMLSTNLGQQQPVVIRSIQPPPAPIATGFVVETDEPETHSFHESTEIQQTSVDLLGLGGAREQRKNFLAPYDPRVVEILLDDLVAVSSQHSVALKAKQQNEQQAQVAHQSLWSFQQVTKQIKGIEPETGRKTAYKYAYQVAVLDENRFAVMKENFACLAKLVKRPVWLSMFEQSHNELELSRYLQDHLPTIKGNIEHLQFWIDKLCTSLQIFGNSISPHSASVLRNLILFVGSTWIEESKKNPELRRVVIRASSEGPVQSHVVDLLGMESPPEIRQNEEVVVVDMSVYLAEKIGSVGGLYWANGLLQPSVESIRNNWFSKIVDSVSTTTSEFDILAILGQVNWLEVVQEASDAEVQDQILLPLQNLLEILATQKYLNAILGVVKIVLFMNEHFPSLSTKCLAVLLRTPWPCKTISENMLRFLKWSTPGHSENIRNIIAVFREIYGIFDGSVKSYFDRSLPDRFDQISRFVAGLGQGHAITQQIYKIDPRVAQVNDNDPYPIFMGLAHLSEQFRIQDMKRRRNIQAQSISLEEEPEVDLSLLVIQELFQVAFIAQIPPMQAQVIRRSALTALSWLCSKEPQYLNSIISEIGLHLSPLHQQADVVVAFFSSIPASTWKHFKASEGSVSVICYFLSHKFFLDVDSSHDVTAYSQSVARMFTDFARSSPVPFGPALSSAATKIGCCLFSLLDLSSEWYQQLPLSKIKFLLALAMSRQFAELRWVSNAIENLHSHFFEPPFDYLLVQTFLSWHNELPHSITANDIEGNVSGRAQAFPILSLFQVVFAARLVKEHYENRHVCKDEEGGG